MARSKVRKSRKTRRGKKRHTRKQRGGNENGNGNTTANNIYPIVNTTGDAKMKILEQLKLALEKRIEDGKQNWLVFFAEFGNGEEKKVFHDTNWVFADNDTSRHERHSDETERILIAIDFDNQADLQLLFDTCEGLFSYITFDGAIVKNINDETLPFFQKGLTNDGLIACKFKDVDLSEIQQENIGVFLYPSGTTPEVFGKFQGQTIDKVKFLIWFLLKVKRMGIPFPQEIETFAQSIGYPFDPNCEYYHYSRFLPKKKECDETEQKILQYAKDHTSQEITNLYLSFLEDVRSKYVYPTFDTTKKLNVTHLDDYKLEDLIILIKKE